MIDPELTAGSVALPLPGRVNWGPDSENTIAFGTVDASQITSYDAEAAAPVAEVADFRPAKVTMPEGSTQELTHHQPRHALPHRSIMERVRDGYWRLSAQVGNIAAMGALGLELNHATNEGSRISVLNAVQDATHNTPLAAAACAATTFAIEGAGAVGTARLLQTKPAKWVSAFIGLKDKGPKEETWKTRAAEVPLALLVGTPAIVTGRHLRDPSRTEEQDRKEGLQVAGVIAGATGAASYFLNSPIVSAWGEVTEHFGEAQTLGASAAILAVSGLTGYVRAKRRLKQVAQSEEQVGDAELALEPAQVVEHSPQSEEVLDPKPPEYNLSDERVAALQRKLVETVHGAHGKTVAAVWLPSASPYADAVRTLEIKQDQFDGIDKIMAPYEQACEFLTLVDTREGLETGRLVHAFRISSPGISAEQRVGTEDEGKPEIAFIQDLVHGGEITEEEIVDYYANADVDLDKCMSVETNFRIGNRAPKFNGLATSDLGYLAIFTRLTANADESRRSGVFAHLNRVAKLSLAMIGVKWVPVAGRADLKTPTVDPENPGAVKTDSRYVPVFIPGTEHNIAVFDKIGSHAPVALDLTAQ